MSQPKAMEKEASEREQCRHGATAPIRGIDQPSVNWRLSRRGRARISEWLKSWQCAFPKSPTKPNQRRGCGGFLRGPRPWRHLHCPAPCQCHPQVSLVDEIKVNMVNFNF